MSDNTITISKSEYQSLLNAQKHMCFMANNPLGNDKDEVLELIANKFCEELPITIYGRDDWFDDVRERAAEIMSEYDRGYDWYDAMDEAIDDTFYKCELTERIICGDNCDMVGIHKVDEEAWDDYAIDATHTGIWNKLKTDCDFRLAGGGSHAHGLNYYPERDEWEEWDLKGGLVNTKKITDPDKIPYMIMTEDNCRYILFKDGDCDPSRLYSKATRMDKEFMETYEPRK